MSEVRERVCGKEGKGDRKGRLVWRKLVCLCCVLLALTRALEFDSKVEGVAGVNWMSVKMISD